MNVMIPRFSVGGMQHHASSSSAAAFGGGGSGSSISSSGASSISQAYFNALKPTDIPIIALLRALQARAAAAVLIRIVTDSMLGADYKVPHHYDASRWRSFGVLVGTTPLHLLCRYNRADAVTELIELSHSLRLASFPSDSHTIASPLQGEGLRTFYAHFDVNAKDAEGSTPLHVACSSSVDGAGNTYAGCVGALLRYYWCWEQQLRLSGGGGGGGGEGALAPSSPPPFYFSSFPPTLAVSHCDVDAVDENGCSPLHLVARRPDASLLVALLVSHGADVNAVVEGEGRRTALHCAAATGVGSNGGGDGSGVGSNISVWQAAAGSSSSTVCTSATTSIAVLVDGGGADLEVCDVRGRTPLFASVFHDGGDEGEEWGADDDGESGADGVEVEEDRAAAHGGRSIAAAAVAAALSAVGGAPEAASSSTTITTLLRHGANILALDEQSATVLHAACGFAGRRVVKLLLAATLRRLAALLLPLPSCCCCCCCSAGAPLLSASSGSGVIISPSSPASSPPTTNGILYVSSGPPLSSSSSSSSAFSSCRGVDCSRCRLLLFRSGGDLLLCDDFGRTPLHVAAIKGNRTAIRALLLQHQQGGRGSGGGGGGGGHSAMVRHTALLSVRDGSGRTAFEIAEHNRSLDREAMGWLL